MKVDIHFKFCRSPAEAKMTAVGFEPTQLALVELESTPLDHSGKLSLATRPLLHCTFIAVDAVLHVWHVPSKLFLLLPVFW